jgi:hypothetical protein
MALRVEISLCCVLKNSCGSYDLFHILVCHVDLMINGEWLNGRYLRSLYSCSRIIVIMQPSQ